MEERRKGYLKDPKLITCIIQRGKADEVVKKALKSGADAATIFFARGTGIRERLGLLKFAISPEKEVIQIVAPREKAGSIFDAMVEAGDLELPGMGCIFMIDVEKALVGAPSPER